MKLFLFFLIPYMLLANTMSSKELENNLLMAENYLWLSKERDASSAIENKTEKYLQIASALLEKNSYSNELIYREKIKSMQGQLETLQKIEADTLEGYYPLLKHMTTDFFFKRSNPKIYTLVRNPKYLAVHNAIKNSTGILRQLHQRHIFINSKPYDSEVEEIAFDIFNETGKFFPRLNTEMVSALHDKDEINAFKENNITQPMINKLCDYVDDDTFYMLTVKRNLTESTDYYYTISAVTYGYKGKNKLMSTDSFGYAIDARGLWSYIIAVHLLLLLFTILFTFARYKEISLKILFYPLFFFTLGRVFPWAIISTLLVFSPDLDANIIYASWWVIALGIALFILPIIAIKMFYSKIVEYVELPTLTGKSEAIGVSVAAGVLAFLIIPFLYDFGNTLEASDIIGYLIFSIAILFNGYVIGKIIDDNDKMDEKYIVFSIVLASILMSFFLHAEFIEILITSFITFSVNSVLLYIFYKKSKKAIKENSIAVNTTQVAKCNNLNELCLKEMVLNPNYQTFDFYSSLQEYSQSIKENRTTYLVLKGEGGAGKTSTAKYFMHELATSLLSEEKSVLLLNANCNSYTENPIAYSMFYDLLDSTMDIDLFGQREKNPKMDKAVQAATNLLLGPLASFISASDNTTQSYSKKDMYLFVKNKLFELSKDNTLILLIDDLQWIDTASEELLHYLMEEFSFGSDNSILFLFTSRISNKSTAIIENLNLQEHSYHIGYIDEKEQSQLLENAFCLDRRTSQWIKEWVNMHNSDKIYPSILVDTVGNLARNDAFSIKDGSFSLSETFDYDNPPIPNNIQNEVRNYVDTHQEYQEILSLTAIFGKEFNVSDITFALDVNYIQCIKTLDTIANESGLIFDNLLKDDVYQFRSQITLDALRKEIGYNNAHSTSTQYIKQLYALSANALEEKYNLNSNPQLAMKIANHYLKAGKLHAKNAIDFSIRAAEGCRKLFLYDEALEYINKANSVAIKSNEHTSRLNELNLLIECDKSHVRGINAIEVAKNALNYLEENSTLSDEVLVTIVRTCFDAGAQSRNQVWFEKSVELAETLLLKSQTLLLQVEGHHFIALGLDPTDNTIKEKRIKHLKEACSLIENKDAVLYSKVANSLAEALSYGNETEKLEAKRLFLESLAIKESAKIKDLPGIARTYGGLGRLAYFSTTQNIESAIDYFSKDLKVSQEINDKRGISQMSSFLGACKIIEKSYQDAIEYFDVSIELANNLVDVHMSYKGKLECLHVMKSDKLTDALNQYNDLLDNNIAPNSLVEDIVGIINKLSSSQTTKMILDKLASIK